MEIPQLKLLAGRVRALLQQTSRSIGHSQALDLVAAVPGLRNWPEVIAFPDRVAACELDTVSGGRLAFRLKKKFDIELSGKELLSALSAGRDSAGSPQRPHVWPGGPRPGVYVTTSDKAITALLDRYEEATDGALVYTERAGSGSKGSIDLGEYGLWSAGIERLPSGTLLVVGPIELDQQSWGESAERLEMACLQALNCEHRVAVLVRTPAPQTLCEDMVLLARSATDQPSDAETALLGVVTEEGDLELLVPFAPGYPEPAAIDATADHDALPQSTREALRDELAHCVSGVVLFGSSDIQEHTAFDQLAAALVLTAHVGPAARIMPRHRGTPAKDWLVPEAIKALPFLPSIESAYAQGYRRLVITPHYLKGDDLLDYEDVLFLGGTYGHQVREIAFRVLTGSDQAERQMLARIVAVLGVLPIAGRRGRFMASDLFVRGASVAPSSGDYSQAGAFLAAQRAIRWEDEVASLLDQGAVTTSAVKKAGGYQVTEFLAQRRTPKRVS